MRNRTVVILTFCFFSACYDFSLPTSDGGSTKGDGISSDAGDGAVDTGANSKTGVNGELVKPTTGADTGVENGKKTYNISGTVSRATTADVTVTLTGTSTATATTDSSGNYTFSGLVDGNYVVTPSLTGYFFSPANRSVTVNSASMMGVDFTSAIATAGTRSISGAVSGAVTTGVTVSLTGTTTATTSTDGSGKYSFGGLPDGKYTVTPSMKGYLFFPAVRSVNISGASVVDMDFTIEAAPAGTHISGKVSGAVASDVTVRLTGATTATTTTDESGSYVFTDVADGKYTITPLRTNYIFSPSNILVTVNSASVSGQDFVSTAIWTQMPRITTADLYSVWGSGPKDVWAAGAAGDLDASNFVFHWDGKEWKLAFSGPATAAAATGGGSGLIGIGGSGPNDVWAVGGSGVIVNWNGNAWKSVSSGTTANLYDIWGCGPNDVWAVGGLYNSIFHWNGRAWTTIETGMENYLDGVWCHGPNDVWVVGSINNTIAHWNGTVWESSFKETDVDAVWGSGSKDVWAIGANSSILHWDGAIWKKESNGVDASDLWLKDIWGSGPNDVWIVGSHGVVLRWDGTIWKSVNTGKTEDFYGVWGSGPNDVWIVGRSGTVLHYVNE